MNILIRRANTQDSPSIIELRRQLDDIHVKERPDLFLSDNCYDETDVSSYLEAEKSNVFVVQNDNSNQIIAYFILNVEKIPYSPILKARTIVYINDICVREGIRSQGIGKKMLEYAVTFTKEMKADALELDVFEANTKAIQFYESIGLKNKTRRMELPL